MLEAAHVLTQSLNASAAYVAAVDPALATSKKIVMTLSVCIGTQPSDADGPITSETPLIDIPFATVYPANVVKYYIHHTTRKELDVSQAIVTNIELPQHGKLTLGKGSGLTYVYISDPGYHGEDRVVSFVDLNGKRYKVITKIIVLDGGLGDAECFDGIIRVRPGVPLPPSRRELNWDWGALQLDSEKAASWFNPDHSNFTVSFSDIPGQSLGTTTVTKK